MKRITITVADDDLVKVIGSLLKYQTDFAVETVEAATTHKSRVHRPGAGVTSEGLVKDHLTARPSRADTLDNLGAMLEGHGYATSTLSGTVSKMTRRGELVRSGNTVGLIRDEKQGNLL